MALGINTNVASLDAQRNLNNTQLSLNTALQRLSSGLRINSAKDDAAGLGIADGMNAQVRGLNQAVRNANDGISMAQTAEGALQEVTDNLQRMRELAVQATNGTNGTNDWANIDKEYQALVTEIKRVGTDTKFNSTVLLNGGMTGATAAKITVSSDGASSIKIDTGAALSTLTGLTASITSATFAAQAIGSIDADLTTVDKTRGTLGAAQNALTAASGNLQNISENLSAAKSRITDADYAAETSNMTKSQILQQAGVAMLSQTNQLPQAVLSLLKG